VLHLITHLAVGGATENTLTTCRYSNSERFESAVLSGQTAHDEENLSSFAEKHQIPVHILPSLRRSIHPLWELRAYRDLVAWFRANSWDVLHTHGSKAGILGRLAAAKAGVPVIIHTVHGWGHHAHMNPLTRRLYILLERQAAKVSGKIIVVARANCKKGLADGIGKPEQYTVIRSGIDIARYRDVEVDAQSLRKEIGIPPHAPVIGTVSRLAAQKAPDDFLKVASMVTAKCPEARFIFVGGGPMQAEFQAGIVEAGLQEAVINLGYRHDIPQILRVFDIFLLTSLWEGLPRVFPQAMCAGLPIVATQVDGAPEAVLEGRTGFMAKPRDCALMSERVLQLLGDEKMRLEMGRNALEYVYPTFCDREMVQQIQKVYLDCYQKAKAG
jgi:glycosyltransferase involved in cell wall biosynthesis